MDRCQFASRLVTSLCVDCTAQDILGARDHRSNERGRPGLCLPGNVKAQTRWRPRRTRQTGSGAFGSASSLLLSRRSQLTSPNPRSAASTAGRSTRLLPDRLTTVHSTCRRRCARPTAGGASAIRPGMRSWLKSGTARARTDRSVPERKDFRRVAQGSGDRRGDPTKRYAGSPRSRGPARARDGRVRVRRCARRSLR